MSIRHPERAARWSKSACPTSRTSVGCTHAGGVVTCRRGALADGQSVTLVVSVTVTASGGLVISTAEVGAREVDRLMANNVGQAGACVNACATRLLLPLVAVEAGGVR
jgi:hypothetical protein